MNQEPYQNLSKAFEMFFNNLEALTVEQRIEKYINTLDSNIQKLRYLSRILLMTKISFLNHYVIEDQLKKIKR